MLKILFSQGTEIKVKLNKINILRFLTESLILYFRPANMSTYFFATRIIIFCITQIYGNFDISSKNCIIFTKTNSAPNSSSAKSLPKIFCLLNLFYLNTSRTTRSTMSQYRIWSLGLLRK